MRSMILTLALVLISGSAFADGSNTVSALGGYGFNGKSTFSYEPLPAKNRDPQISLDRGAIFGVEYQHRFDSISTGVEVLSNGSALGSIGLNF